MSKYRDEPPRQIGTSFSDKMRNFLDEKIRTSRNGIDMNMDRKGASQSLIFWHHIMDEEVFNLGCKIQEKHPEFDYKPWVHWMVDAEIDRHAGGIIIKHRSDFFCQYADKYCGQAIRDYYGVPVRFTPDYSIKMRVEQ